MAEPKRPVFATAAAAEPINQPPPPPPPAYNVDPFPAISMIGAASRLFGQSDGGGGTGSSLSSQFPQRISTSTFVSIPGFVDTTFKPTLQPPPPSPSAPPADGGAEFGESSRPERHLPTSIGITVEDAREALDIFVQRQCCYGAADKICIRDIQMRSAYKYNLISLVEQREIVWKSEPWNGQSIHFGLDRIAGPWDYEVPPTKAKSKVRLAGTDRRVTCDECIGLEMVESVAQVVMVLAGDNVHGVMGVAFDKTRGALAVKDKDEIGETVPAPFRCTWCTGNGQVRCSKCEGQGQLLMYLQLIVTWNEYKDEFITGSTAIPKKRISKARAVRAIFEERPNAFPLSNFPDGASQQASGDLITKHAMEYGRAGRILNQTQILDVIRVAGVTHTYEQPPIGVFAVYGENNDVYFPDYPDNCNCCCFCSIL